MTRHLSPSLMGAASAMALGSLADMRAAHGVVAVRAEQNTPEVSALLDDLAKTFADFRAENDKRIEDLAAGKADVVLDEKVDRINSAISDIQAAVDEQSRQVARLQVGSGDSGQSDADVRREALMFHAAMTGRPFHQIEADVDVDAYRAYGPAFEVFLRRGGRNGEILAPSVQAELSVGIDSDGGFFVPVQMADRVLTRLFESSPMREICSVMNITTDTIEFPTDTNSGTSGGWVAEKATRAETATPRVGTHKIEVHEQYAEPHATQKLLDDAAVDIETWLSNKIADILGRTENTAFVTGSGVGQPRGITSYGAASVTTADASRAWGVLQYIASGSTSGFPALSGVPSATDVDTLIDLIAALKPAYRTNARFLMSRATEAVIRKAKDGDGRYLVGMGDISDGVRGFTLFGFPIATGEDMPTIASDSYSIAFGDFREGYQIVDRMGIRVLRDPFTSKPFVKFYTTKRVGGDVVNFDAIKLMKFATS